MEHRKTLLGLKAAPAKLVCNDSEDEDSYFGDDNGAILTLPPQNSQPLLPILDSNDEKQEEKPSNRIKSFDEIFPRLSQIMNLFEDHSSLPTHYSGEIYFIPEHIVPDEYSTELNNFINSTDPDAEFHFPDIENSTEISQNIFAQIDIVKYAKKQKVDLSKYSNESLDSRVLSLIDFILSKQDDAKISCYYCMQSLLELIKTFEFAPISSLFPDYCICSIIHQLSLNLVKLFPHHPLLESILHKFSTYDPKALDALSLIPNDSGNSDSFDDDFFADLQSIQSQKTTINLNSVFNESVLINPLHNIHPSTQCNVVTIFLYEPPSMITYEFLDKSTEINPNVFESWAKSINEQSQAPIDNKSAVYESPSEDPQIYESDTIVKISGSVPKQETYLSASTPKVSFNVPIKIDSPDEVDKGLLISLMQHINHPSILISYLSYVPNTLDLDLFPYLYPLLQVVNVTAAAPLKKGCIYPKLIVYEFDACQVLNEGKQNKIVKLLSEMATKVPADSKRTEIKPLQQKRSFPTISTPCPQNIVSIICLSDIEIILSGRSPLTGERIFRDQILKPPFSREWRSEVLYNMYTSTLLPPYISFRVAFALALNLSDIQPDKTALAVDILFEAIYGLLNALPKMAMLECVRSSILLFGELLDRLDRYYYSALFLDQYFLGNPNYQTSSQISPICQHRGDMVRSVFHFNQTMNFFIQMNRCDEALYVSQVITSMYNDFGLYFDSISLFTYLLRKTYKLSVGRNIQKVSIKKVKTMPPVRQSPNQISFEPNPSNTNTLLCGISLATLFVKCRYFKLAKELLASLNSASTSRHYLQLIKFVSLKRLLRKNKFTKLINSLPQLPIRQKRSSTGSRLTSLSASTFDTVIAIIKMLMSGLMNRSLLGHSIFWCEVILNTQTKFNLKDIGIAFLIRGEGFLKYKAMSSVTNGLLSVHVPLNQSMSNVGEYRDNHIFQNQTEILQEAISCFKAARICFEKVGYQRKLLISSLFYVSAVLQHFIDELGYLNEEPLEIKNPRLETKSKNNTMHQQVVTFEEYEITLSNLEEHLSVLCKSIETMTSRYMNPFLVIFSEIAYSKFNLFQKDLTSSKKRFEFAYTNFKNLFTCGGYVLLHDLSLNFIRVVYLILQFMCQLLLLFDKDFINNHLLAFDWLNDCESIVNKMNRVVQNENNEPIDPSIIVSLTSLKSMANRQFPDFFQTLATSNVEVNDKPSIHQETVQSYLFRINANIKLFELQKISESQFHEDNRNLCKSIENLADSFRHDHPYLIPPEADYNIAIRPPSIASQAVFVQQLFDGIFVYVPFTGEKRFCPFFTASTESSSNSSSHAFSYPKSVSIPQLIGSDSTENKGHFGDLLETELITSDSNSAPSQIAKSGSLPPPKPIFEQLNFDNNSDIGEIDQNDKTILLGEPFSDDDNDKNTKKDIKSELVNDEKSDKLLQKELQDFITKSSSSFTISLKKMPDQIFTSSSRLFPTPLFEYIAYLILPDKSNKKFTSNVNQKTKLKFIQKIQTALFGIINLEQSLSAEDWQKKPDKQVFFNIKSSNIKGSLETVSKAPPPIVFITSNSLKSLPFEIMFPNKHVLRCWNYSQLILPGKSTIASSSNKESQNNLALSVSKFEFDSDSQENLKLTPHSSNETSSEMQKIESEAPNDASKPKLKIIKSTSEFENSSCKTQPIPSSDLETAFIESDSKQLQRRTPSVRKKKIHTEEELPKTSSTPRAPRSNSLVVNSSQFTPISNFYQYGISPILFRKKGEFETSILRSLDLLKSIIISCGGSYRYSPESVFKSERATPYMCPAFLSGKETSYYQQKYPFCAILDNETINDELAAPSTLFLFSYADFSEFHDSLRKLSMEYPSSFFMFIPGQIFKEALKSMKLIFERQRKRKSFTLGKKDEHLDDHIRLSKVPYEFVSTLRFTLSNMLNCPIPLIGSP